MNTLRGWAVGLSAALVLGTVHVIPMPGQTLLWRAILDFSHVPLFGAVTLGLYHGSRRLLAQRFPTRLPHFAVAGGGALLLGAAGEALQTLGPRNASPLDLLRDGTGAVIALLLAATRMRQGDGEPWIHSTRFRRVLRLVAVLLLGAALTPLLLWGRAYHERAGSFPYLCRFESAWEMRFLSRRGIVVELCPAPAAWARPAGERVARLTFIPVRYPAIALEEPYPDWRGFDDLVFDLFSELDEPVTLHLRIEDRTHDQSYHDRFNQVIEVPPGATTVRFAVEQIERAPQGRRMDLSSMRRISLFALPPTDRFTLFLDDLRLEKRSVEAAPGAISG